MREKVDKGFTAGKIVAEIYEIEKRVSIKKDKQGRNMVYVKCLVRNKEIKLTPEELIRQLYIQKLVTEYGYPVERMKLKKLRLKERKS